MRDLLKVKKKKNKANQLKVNSRLAKITLVILHILKCDMMKLKMDFKEETIWLFDLKGLGATGMVVGRFRNIKQKTQNPTTHENIQTEQGWQNRDATGDLQV